MSAKCVVGLLCALGLAGCESLHVYDGPQRPHAQLAYVAGDLRVNAGAEFVVVLRSVDDVPLGLRYRGVAVLPGEHNLLIDCTVTESKRSSRHALRVDVQAGRYALQASPAPGNQGCGEISLVRN